jgi:hypothetical protein
MILEPLDLTTFAITTNRLVPFAKVDILHFSFQWHKLLLLSSFYCLHCASCSFYFLSIAKITTPQTTTSLH